MPILEDHHAWHTHTLMHAHFKVVMPPKVIVTYNKVTLTETVLCQNVIPFLSERLCHFVWLDIQAHNYSLHKLFSAIFVQK